MKKIFALTLSLIFIFTVLTACNNPADNPSSDNGTDNTSSSAEYEKGTFDETGFESKYLNLKFDLPDGFVMATEEDINTLMDLGSEALDIEKDMVDYAKLTSVYEMMASSPNGYPNVIVMVEKLSLSNITTEQYIDALKSQLSSITAAGYEISDDIATVEIAGQSYQQLTVTTNIYGQTLTQNYIVRKSDNRMVCFVTSSTPDAEEELSTLMQGFSSYQ